MISSMLSRRFIFVELVFGLFWLCLLQGSLHAAPVVDRIDPGIMPAYIESYLLDCGGTNGAVAQTGWVSLRGRPTETVIDVTNATTTSVDLQYNVAGIVCRSSIKGGIVSTTNGIIGTNPSGLGIAGTGAAYTYGANNGDLSLGTPIPFTYTAGTAFTVTTDINIGISEKRIHTYSVNPRYRCVTNPRDTNFRTPASSVDFGACRSIAVPVFTIRVNVPPAGNPPIGTIDAATCRLWSGWAFDRDRSSASIAVHVYMDASAGSPGSTFVGEFIANSPRSDVNAVHGISGNHGFEIAVPAAYQNSSRRIYMYAIGISSSGARDGENAYLGTLAYNACPAAPSLSCTVSGGSILAGQTVTPSILVRHNGPATAPTSSFAGSLLITSQPNESISGSVSNGATVTVNGATRTYTAPGSYSVTASLTSSSTAGGGAFSCVSTITVTAPPPVITCSVTSGGVDVGSNGFVTASIRHTGPQYAPNLNYTATVTITSQPSEALTGSVVNGAVAVRDSTPLLYPNAGVYAVGVSVSATGGGYTVSTSCATTITVYARPYVRTYNNDVQAGYGFANAGVCENGTGDITAYARSGANSYSGSGTQLGAFARGQISGFRTASTLTTAASLPEVLGFANTTLVNTATGRFGGSFSAGNCMFDYWSQSSRAAVITNQTIDISTLASGSYYIEQTSATVPVVITGQIANGRRVSVYVSGTAFVRGASVGYSSTNWVSRSDIPSLYVIARGAILIGSDVRNLDGNYIAQNRNLTDGRITTCANSVTLSTFSDSASLIANCGNRLVVNGSFSARRINFLRTIGTVNASAAGEPVATSNAAEVFVYSLENFTSEQPLDGIQQQTYDSITALPPIL